MEHFLLGTLGDPRLQPLVAEFRDTRQQLVVHDEVQTKQALRHLIATIRTILEDRQALLVLNPSSSFGSDDPETDNAREMLTLAESLLDGVVFRDALAILFVLQRKIPSIDSQPPPQSDDEREQYLVPVDDFLRLLGFPGTVSVCSMWRCGSNHSDQRNNLFDAVDNLLRVVKRQCTVEED